MILKPKQSSVAVSTDVQQGWEESLRRAVATNTWLQENKHLLTHKDGLAWKGDRMYIPKDLRQSVLQRCHDAEMLDILGFLKPFI